jgi:1,2-phenylacetyl-CoA epoxidase catalytic subunit
VKYVRFTHELKKKILNYTINRVAYILVENIFYTRMLMEQLTSMTSPKYIKLAKIMKRMDYHAQLGAEILVNQMFRYLHLILKDL